MDAQKKQIKSQFDEMRASVQGKDKQPPPLTTFEVDQGEVVINGKKKQPRTHIVHLQFNPEENKVVRHFESKSAGVKGTKKTSFLSSKMRTDPLI